MTKLHWILLQSTLKTISKVLGLCLGLFICLYFCIALPFHVSSENVHTLLFVLMGIGTFSSLIVDLSLQVKEGGGNDFLLSTTSSIKKFVTGIFLLHSLKTLAFYVLIVVMLCIDIPDVIQNLSWQEIAAIMISLFPLFVMFGITAVSRNKAQVQIPSIGKMLKQAIVGFFGMLIIGTVLAVVPIVGACIIAQIFLWSLYHSKTSIFKSIDTAVIKKWLKLSSVSLFTFYAVCFVGLMIFEPKSMLLHIQLDRSNEKTSTILDLSKVKTPMDWIQWDANTPRPTSPEMLVAGLEALERICPSHLESYLGAICFSQGLESNQKVNLHASPKEAKLLALLQSPSHYAQLLALYAHFQLPTQKQSASVQLKIDELAKQDPAFAVLVEKLKAMKQEIRDHGLPIWVFPGA